MLIQPFHKKYQDQFVKKHGVKLGFMSLFTKACTIAMRNHPLVNAQIEGDNMIIPQYVDMGIAVSSAKGLVVPVVRNSEAMGLAEIAKEIGSLYAVTRGNLDAIIITGGLAYNQDVLQPLLEYLDTVRESRTGVTRYNQGLDADSLNKTATGVNALMSQSQMRMELIARVFAETGVKDLFKRIKQNWIID